MQSLSHNSSVGVFKQDNPPLITSVLHSPCDKVLNVVLNLHFTTGITVKALYVQQSLTVRVFLFNCTQIMVRKLIITD